MRSAYPETMAYLKARRARHPREDAIDDATEWTLTGEKVATSGSAPIPKPGQRKSALVVEQETAKVTETEEEYIARRCEEYMHKRLSTRRSATGSFFEIGGGGDGGEAYKVV